MRNSLTRTYGARPMTAHVRAMVLCAVLVCCLPLHAAAPADNPASGAHAAAPAQSLRLLPPARWAEENALLAAISLYPQLLQQQPPLEVATVALAFHPDGRVATSEIRLASPPPTPAAGEVRVGPAARQGWVEALLPAEGERPSVATRRRGAMVAGARLAADVTVYFTRVPENFNAARSAARVRRIVAPIHRDLLFTGDDTRHRLTVLLNDDGSLLQRRVDRIARTSVAESSGARSAEDQAAELAARLEIEVTQIGLVGSTLMQNGAELYVIDYAWRRRAGELGPQLLKPLPPATLLDTATAQALLELHFPDANESAGTPAFMLSMDGELIRTGRVPLQDGGLTHASLQAPLLAGQRVEALLLHPVGVADRARNALFVWQATGAAEPPAQQIAAQPPAAAPRTRLVSMPASSRLPDAAQAGATLDAAEGADHALHVLLQAYPEILDDANRNGWYSASVALRADGTLLRGGLRFADDRVQAIRDILDLRYIPETAVQRAGTTVRRSAGRPELVLKNPGDVVAGGRVLQNHLLFHYTILPPDHEAQRSLLTVWEAALNRHGELLLPREAPVANRVTILLTEDGQIARERVEAGVRSQMLQAPPDFTVLGLRAEEIGVQGSVTLIRNDYSEVDAAPADQQLLRAALWSALGVRDELRVHYAWLRRPGEPAGGASRTPAGVTLQSLRQLVLPPATSAADTPGRGAAGLRISAAEALQSAP